MNYEGISRNKENVNMSDHNKCSEDIIFDKEVHKFRREMYHLKNTKHCIFFNTIIDRDKHIQHIFICTGDYYANGFCEKHNSMYRRAKEKYNCIKNKESNEQDNKELPSKCKFCIRKPWIGDLCKTHANKKNKELSIYCYQFNTDNSRNFIDGYEVKKTTTNQSNEAIVLSTQEKLSIEDDGSSLQNLSSPDSIPNSEFTDNESESQEEYDNILSSPFSPSNLENKNTICDFKGISIYE